jgi:hypothetical protein
MWDIALHDLSRPFRAQYRPFYTVYAIIELCVVLIFF